jgi:hypothetical protein
MTAMSVRAIATGIGSSAHDIQLSPCATGGRGCPQSRREALTGTIGARRPWTASMISALSMPCGSIEVHPPHVESDSNEASRSARQPGSGCRTTAWPATLGA